MSLYHVTCTDRTTGKTETGRVYAGDRKGAISAAYFKYYNAKRASIRAVCTKR